MPKPTVTLTPKQQELYNKIKKPEYLNDNNAAFHANLLATIAQMPENANTDKIAEVVMAIKEMNTVYLVICFGQKAAVSKHKASLVKLEQNLSLAIAALGECIEEMLEIIPDLLYYNANGFHLMSRVADYSSPEYLIRMLEKYPHFQNFEVGTLNHPLSIYLQKRESSAFFQLLNHFPNMLVSRDAKNITRYLTAIAEKNLSSDPNFLFDFIKRFPSCLESNRYLACIVAQENPQILFELLNQYPVLLHEDLALIVAAHDAQLLLPLLKQYPLIDTPKIAVGGKIVNELVWKDQLNVLFDLLVFNPKHIAYDPAQGLWKAIKRPAWSGHSENDYAKQGQVNIVLARVANEFEAQLQSNSREHAIQGLKILVDNAVGSAKSILQRHQIEYSSPVPELEKARLQREQEQANLAREEAKRKWQEPPVPVARQMEQVAQSASSSVDQQLLSEITRLKEVNQTQAQALDTMSRTNLLLLQENQCLKSEAGVDEQKVKRSRTVEPETCDAGGTYTPGASLFFNGAQARK